MNCNHKACLVEAPYEHNPLPRPYDGHVTTSHVDCHILGCEPHLNPNRRPNSRFVSIQGFNQNWCQPNAMQYTIKTSKVHLDTISSSVFILA